ncbi:sugar transferase [Deinococcus marmoris]|uniref:sugar transferase n=1 Tax=Deinococcus marmoris TaxID=249408 RepID=UPI0006905DEE|nr:sugar transferase [Deinococcus marmoris]
MTQLAPLNDARPPDLLTADQADTPVVRAHMINTNRLSRRAAMNGAALVASDFVVLWLVSGLVLSFVVEREATLPGQIGFTSTWLIAAIVLRSYPGYGLDVSERLRRSMISACAALPSLIIAALVTPHLGMTGLGTLLLCLLACLLLTILGKTLVRITLRALNIWGVDVAVIGTGESTRDINEVLRNDWELGYLPVDSGMAKLAILAVPNIPYAMRDRLLDGPLASFRQVLVMVSQPASDSCWAGSSYLGPFSVMEVHRRHLEPSDLRQKRALDLLLVVLFMPLIAPLLLVIAVVVALDSPGPVLYGAPRLGRGGRSFNCLKFRTMHGDAEDKLAALLQADPEARAYYAHYHKLRDDPRITRAGRFLRSASLDELPQLLNVFRGEMSLVGPRPYLQREVSEIEPYTEVILSCRPGITGLWQVSGRSSTSFKARVQLDLQYVRRWSPWLDLTLLMATVLVTLRRRGAA